VVIADCSASAVANAATARYVGAAGVDEVDSPTVSFTILDEAGECEDEPPRPEATPVFRPIAFTG